MATPSGPDWDCTGAYRGNKRSRRRKEPQRPRWGSFMFSRKNRQKVEERGKKTESDNKEREGRRQKKAYNPLGFMGCVLRMLASNSLENY